MKAELRLTRVGDRQGDRPSEMILAFLDRIRRRADSALNRITARMVVAPGMRSGYGRLRAGLNGFIHEFAPRLIQQTRLFFLTAPTPVISTNSFPDLHLLPQINPA